MNYFGKLSMTRRSQLDPRLQAVADEAIKVCNFAITCGHRGYADQEAACRAGTSHLHFPNSLHNRKPSLAMDCAPYPVDWKNIPRFEEMAKVILAAAERLGIPLEWGGNWPKFKDYPHFQLIEGKGEDNG